ncbi:MAG TPA: carboxypeptidase regulatory-like domain-containing protein, partial [Segetibacter sp.]
MKKSFTLIILVVTAFFSASVAGQNKTGKVTGIAQSADGKAIEGTTVTLLKAKDSSLVKVALSNKTGEFELEKIADGKYLIKLSAVGFAPAFTKSFELSESNSLVELKSIPLKTANKELGNVQVTTIRPLIENKIDKMVVNVEASVTNVGSTAMDVLEKSPGISVDRDGNISLKGKQGVIILMDGKPTYLSGQDLANLLKNTPAGQLDQIEIMSQPSAKFDASGNSGVINIKTKRTKQIGFNGSATIGYTQGVYPKSNNSFNINYRKGKVNFFANYSYSYFKGFNDITINRKFRNPATKLLTGEIDQVSTMSFTGQPHSLKIGADLFASKKTTFGIVLNGFYNVRKGGGNSLAEIGDGYGNVTSYNNAISSNR